MSHRALYLTHRPQTFADLAGQNAVAETLRRALATGRSGHAYVFTGPRGTGKTTTARLVAKGLNCTNLSDGEPDNSCDLCVAINAGNALDVIEVDAASNRGIDEIREIRDKVGFAPSQAEKKVYIIDEAHMLTKEAFNALLKTLEEPPAHAVFILATTEPQKVPQTILSRCQRFDFRAPTVPVIAGQLAQVATAEKIDLPEDSATLLARYAKGSFRDALSLLDLMRSVTDEQITPERVRATLGLADQAAVAKLERALASGNAADALSVIRTVVEQGTAPETFRLAVIEHLRELLVAAAGGPASETVQKLAADWTVSRLVDAVRTFLAAEDTGALTAELPLELAALEVLRTASGNHSDKPEPPAVAPTERAHTNPPVTKSEKTNIEKSDSSPKAPAADRPVAETPSDRQDHKPSGRPNHKPPSDAAELWEELLKATKGDYSLSVCLQRTRPVKLTKDTLELHVQSDFFLKKLEHPQTHAKISEFVAAAAGRKVTPVYALATAEETDLFDEALNIFAGAKVE